MLPLYTNDGTNFASRKWSPGLFTAYHSRASSGGHKYRFLNPVLKALVAFFVSIPLILLIRLYLDQLSGNVHSFASSGYRRALDDERHIPGSAVTISLPAAHLKNLVLVAGHAVYTQSNYHAADKEESWFLEPYQQVEGEARSFLEHIQLGICEAAADPDALLLFSGGQTRLAAGPRSEGLSYWVVAEAFEWWNNTEVRSRTFTEEHARDSFENLLFSLCRFFELTGHYPEHLTVISYSLKEERFTDLHRSALHFPLRHFRFIGTPLPPAVTGAEAGEAATKESFISDPYGCSGPLIAKRMRRDPFAVGPPHPSRCPAMAGLLAWCGPGAYPKPLPWHQVSKTEDYVEA